MEMQNLIIILRVAISSCKVAKNASGATGDARSELRQIREQPYFAAMIQIADFLLSCPAALLDDQRSAIKQQQQDSGA